MSKITFRADADLVERVEHLDASKSEVMREALREYLDGREVSDTSPGDLSAESLDGLLEQRVDELVEERLEERRDRTVNVNVNLERSESRPPSPAATVDETAEEPTRNTCAQCGEEVDDSHAYCPNCGENVSENAYCDCGAELSPDWMFCPHCGRRTPSASVLDR